MYHNSNILLLEKILAKKLGVSFQFSKFSEPIPLLHLQNQTFQNPMGHGQLHSAILPTIVYNLPCFSGLIDGIHNEGFKKLESIW